MQPLESDGDEPADGFGADSGLSFAGLTEFRRPPASTGGPDLGPGSQLGDVTIIRLVDEGGMGRVYEGLQGMPCRTVAVKVIKPGMLSVAATRRFEHEAQILGRLTHPGIARIYSLGMQQLPDGAVPYFVMEFIEDARPITVYAGERNLTPRDRVTLFREACRAVAHGHQRGVIHRDLKPGNMLVDAAGQPKIIDFGVARSTDADVALTTMHTDVGQLVGTLAYMAPEQFDGTSDDLDLRTDVYALGVVLYELLTGSPPYELPRRAVYDVARVVKDVDPKPLSAFNPKLRGDLSTIVAKCLEKDRSRRYSTAAELEADLGRYLRGEPISATPPSLVDSIVRLGRRHRLAATAAVGILTALLAAVVGISIFAIRAERQRELAEAARREAVHQARQAADERETARRETARADAEAETSRHRLYVANLRSMQGYLADKNLRPARQLDRENREIAGSPLPLEMHCLGAELDEALVVLDTGRETVSRVAFSADGGMLEALAVTAPKRPGIHLGESRRIIHAFFHHPRSTMNLHCGDVFCFSVAGHHRYTPAGTDGPLREPTGQPDAAPPLATSPCGNRVALQTPDGGIRIVERLPGRREANLEGHRGRVTAATFSPSGSHLAAVTTRGGLVLWDSGTGRLLMRSDPRHGTVRFEFSPDGARLATVTRDDSGARRVLVYATADGRQLCSVSIRKGQGESDSLLAFSPDGGRLVTSSHEHGLQVWSVADGALVAQLRDHPAVVTALAYSPDGGQIASATANGTIRIWNADTFALEGERLGHDGIVGTLAFRDDGETLASGSYDGTVRIWSRTATAPLAVLAGVGGMTAVAYRPDGLQLAVAPAGKGVVELWDPHTVERTRTLGLAGHTGADTITKTVHQIAYSPDGRLVAAACETADRGGFVGVWNTDTGEQLHAFGDHARGAVTVTFSPDGSRLLTTSGDEVLLAWDLVTGRRLMAIPARQQSPLFRKIDAVFGLEGSRVAYKQPQVFDAATGEVVNTLPPQGQVTAVAVSPDGLVLATGMAIGNVYLTDLATGTRRTQLVGHLGGVQAIAFSPDGRRVVTGSQDGSTRLWDAETGDARAVFHGHEGNVEQAQFAPDGRRIITSAADGTVRIWDADRGQELCTLPGQRDWPRAIALCPDGTRLVTAGSDGTVRIRGLSTAEVTAARRAAADGAAPVTARP
ncbi:MAG: protein kinase domain-containing protein [Planctomycetia bacterium]